MLELIARRLEDGGAVPFVVTSASMAPFLLPGDCITVRAIVDRPVRPGDLVLARVLPRPIVHRVVACRWRAGEGRFTTKGDNTVHCDAPLADAEIVGRVYRIERRGKRLDLPCCLARRSGVALAWLSRLQCRSAMLSHPMACRLAARVLRVAIWVGAWLTWQVIARANSTD